MFRGVLLVFISVIRIKISLLEFFIRERMVFFKMS